MCKVGLVALARNDLERSCLADHIFTLQHSLNHIERVLSQSHPSYLSSLRSSIARSKGSTDKGLLYLTTVSIAVLSCQTTIGEFCAFWDPCE